MSLFKCKMCGGTLEINNNETVATCEYCGTQQTLPKLDDERRANLYDRANHFRRNNEFDKAMGIYEQILNEDNTDSEAYWSLVLCRYGIEYVEDPSSHKRIPTVNRAQFTSIFDDDNYKSAIEYADGYQKAIYEDEAKAINEIQKGILAISQKEEPFDVFICYKETDNSGRRTPDSVLANDLYHQLTQEGFKVFFARITLEDKLGSAYEPYIFAALNSSKVMVALGTKPEFFNAVWVKNEWSRYLALIKNGANKILIPAYKDMDPYDLPEEFSHLQAQDMSKLGFMQDLIRGIKKITEADMPKTTVVKETVISGGNANTAPLLKRAFMFLEDGDWSSANEYCEKVLDIDPECARAYLGKLMAELKVKTEDTLCDCSEPFDNYDNYAKVMRFADAALQTKLKQDIEHINIRNENERLEGVYTRAKNAMSSAKIENQYKAAAQLFKSVGEYKDAESLAKECYEKAEEVRKDAILIKGKNNMVGERVSNYLYAIEQFKLIAGWKDADEKLAYCERKIEEIKAKQAQVAKLNKKIAIITTPIVCAIIAFIIVLNTVIIPNGKYNDAIELMESGKYEQAIAAFEAMDGYKESVEKITECETGILDGKYNDAIALMDAGKYIEAYEALIALDGYKDSEDKANSIYVKYKVEKLKVAKVGDYVVFGSYKQGKNTSNRKKDIEWLVLEAKDGKVLLISKYALDCKPYNTSKTDVTWEICTLRKWLNNDFINAAFSADEKAMIPTVTVSAEKNPEYNTHPGNATQDKVFLLSITEANEYFSTIDTRQCEATDYVAANGALVDSDGNCVWWLRSPGWIQACAAEVSNGGGIAEDGTPAYHDSYTVRPALWIDLNS